MVLMAQGKDVIHLEVGRPNFDTPLHIKEAAKQALDDGIVHYGEFAGEFKLREAISGKLKSFNKLDASPDEILVTNGLTHAAYAVFMAAVDEGDEVILLEPYYPQHINKIELAGGKVVTAPLDRENGFQIDRAAIEARITDNTRMICIVNPANPTGRVMRSMNRSLTMAINTSASLRCPECGTAHSACLPTPRHLQWMDGDWVTWPARRNSCLHC
jgi:aspartate aminotransferase